MRRTLASLCVLASISLPLRAGAQTALAPEMLGPLVGPGASPAQPDLRLYGTDLGWTYEHAGRHFMLFGDTWPHAGALCEGEPRNDDSVASLPLAPPDGLPPLVFETAAGAPADFAPLRVRRGDDDLTMAYGQVPLTGFSDGRNAFAILGRGEPVRCTARKRGRDPVCRKAEHLACTQDVGECAPASVAAPMLCDPTSGAGCLPGATCEPSPTGFCIDPTSSQHDGTPASLRFTVAHAQEIVVQDAADPAGLRSVATLPTNKLINATARTVTCFSGGSCGNDYRPGAGALFVWGRPFFTGEQGRQAQLYLMMHRLPIRLDRRGRMRLRPLWYAGVHPESGEPLWSRRQSRAMPLALDGVGGGSPHEVLPISDQMAISWVPEPVSKWMMLYGGDLADYLLADPANARPGPVPGAIQVRFADHPWGPWTAPEPHLAPGSPGVVGDPYGPGGVLFHPECVDREGASCAQSDPSRPPDFFLPGCPPIGATFDAGRFYGVNVIDAWMRRADANAVDVYWNVSTWNPYGVSLVRSRVLAGSPSATATCPAPRSRPRKGLGGKPKRLRWCGQGS